MQFTHVMISLAIAIGATCSPAVLAASPSIVRAQENAPGEPGAPLTYDDYMRLGYNAQQERRYFAVTQYCHCTRSLNPEDRAVIIAYWHARNALNNRPEPSLSFDQ